MAVRNILSRIIALTLVAGASSVSLPLLAEESTLAIEEIIVTARKRAESAQEIPVAVTALTAELENASVRNLTDLTGYAPNLIFEEDGSRGGGGADINIRGISPTRSDDNSFDAPIAVVIDGIYLGTLAGQVLENFDLERVEVLRGPQGTLFGKNTVGGVINVVRSRPTGETGARFKLTGGEDGQQEVRAVVNFGLNDSLALKLFGSHIESDGFYSNRTTGSDVGDREYQNVGATLLWEPNEKFEAMFTAEIFRDEGTLNAFQTNYNVAPGVLPAPAPGSPDNDFSGGFVTCLVFGECRTSLSTPSFSTNDSDNDFELDTDAFTLRMEYDINDNFSLVSITGYRDVEEYRIYDFDGTAAPFITIERWNEYDQTSQEFQLNGTFENVSFTAGLYYFRNEFEQDWVTGAGFWDFVFGSFGLGPASDPTAWGICVSGALGALACDPGLTSVPAGDNVTQILFETQETTSYAVYGQMDWTFADRWTLTAGLRWTKEEKEFVAGQAYLSNVARQRLRVFPQGFADLENDWTEVSPKIGLTYDVSEDSILYVSYAEGFHSGGFFGVNQNIADFERDQYDPEFANNWEVGYKSQHFDNRLLFNLTYFYNDFEDKQESFIALDASTNTVATVFDNAASVIYQGWELETQFVANEYLRLFFNYGYLDAEYDEFQTDINPNDNATIIQDATFLEPRNAPEFTYSFGGTLSIPMGEGSLEIFAKYTKIDDVETDLLNLTQTGLDEREDLSFSVGYYRDNWSISAFGRNVTDEQQEVFTPISNLFAVGSVGRPDSYGLEFTYEFGQ